MIRCKETNLVSPQRQGVTYEGDTMDMRHSLDWVSNKRGVPIDVGMQVSLGRFRPLPKMVDGLRQPLPPRQTWRGRVTEVCGDTVILQVLVRSQGQEEWLERGSISVGCSDPIAF